MKTPLHSRLPYTPWADSALKRLPGMQRAKLSNAFQTDELYAEQMAERLRILSTRHADVVAYGDDAKGGAAELLSVGLDVASGLDGFIQTRDTMCCPDGREVVLDPDMPLETLGQLFQQDYCLLDDTGAEPVLCAAVLCFPAGWTLREKLGRPMLRIHAPVDAYDLNLARRVNRLFETLTPERPLWRANALPYAAADLYAPRTEAQAGRDDQGEQPFLRSERQVLFRLPKTRMVAFSIHTIVVPRHALTPEQRASLAAMER